MSTAQKAKKLITLLFLPGILEFDRSIITLFETENEWQKTKPIPIPLPRASRNFPDVKTRNEKKTIIGQDI